MLAIFNSWGLNPPRRVGFRAAAIAIGLITCGFPVGWVARTTAAEVLEETRGDLGRLVDQAEFAQKAQKAYEAAKAKFEADTNNPVAQWKFGRACYDWADFAKSDAKREEIARQGIAACRALITRNPSSAEGHYYLGMDLGQVAQTKLLGALKIVDQMEIEFKASLAVDPKFDYAGPDRNLALLYHESPGWPASIGSKTRARLHFEKALNLAPDYPENLLNLIEAELTWNEKNNAARDLKTLDDLWPKARAQFTGEDWAASWADWTTRRDAVKKKITQPSKTVEPPRKFPNN